ncbi:MAG: hypothetical protein LBM59_00535 [Ruminococcus sp.]|jgi:hypothetical protein|nr:hypothetical protein [Ruminococcus sp.]
MNERILPPKPDISPDFTLEDIRKIRDYHYELSKIQTPEEIRERRRKATEEAYRQMAEIRASGKELVYPKRIEV